jgi:hypothetical protein
MRNLDFLRFCMESGGVGFDATDIMDGWLVNPIMKDDLYIEVFFSGYGRNKRKRCIFGKFG